MAKILVVDDEASIRNMISMVLTSQGHTVLEADNGVTALDMIKTQFPQLIISDVMMSNMNGFVLREILQQDPLTARIPMIMMTGNSKKAGAWQSDPEIDYLAKPFTVPELTGLVKIRLQADAV